MMSKKNKELDVDFIGEQGAELTSQEQQAISEFIRKQKEKRSGRKPKKVASASTWLSLLGSRVRVSSYINQVSLNVFSSN